MTGEHVLMEINVRIPQNVGLGEAAGVDPSWRLYATLAGIPLAPQRPQRNGVKVIVPSLELMAAPAYVRAGRPDGRRLLRSYRGVRTISGLSLGGPRAARGVRGRSRVSTASKARAESRRAAKEQADATPFRPGTALKRMLPVSAAPHRKARRTTARWAPGGAGPCSPKSFADEAVGSRRLGSPLYGTLLERVADDVEAQGPCWRLLAETWPRPAARCRSG